MRRPFFHLSFCIALLGIAVGGAAEDVTPLAEPGPTWFSDPWRTNDGLPNNDVTGVTQGGDGALMVGTMSGLARFDGLRFRKMQLPVPGDENAAVSGVAPGRHGKVWVVSRGYAFDLIGQESKGVRLPQMPSGSRLTAVFVTADETLWVSYDGGGVLRVADGKAVMVKGDAELPASFATMVGMDAKGEVWAAGSGVLARWTGAKFQRKTDIPEGKVVLTAARDGGLWIGAGRSLFRYTEDQGVKAVGELFATHPRARVSTMLEDSDGRVWCGTFNAGLHCWSGNAFERVSVSHHDVWALAEDLEHNIWVGTGGNGLVRVRQRVLRTFDERGGPVNQTPRSLCVDAQQQVWVVTQTGDLYVRETSGWRQVNLARDLRTGGATCVVADDKETVWVACADNKVGRWDGKSFHEELLPPVSQGVGRIYAMMVARDGSLWVGRNDELLQQSSGNWRTYAPASSRGIISTLAQDRAGVIWAGTNRSHLLRVEGTRLVKDGIQGASGAIRCLLPTPDGALWVGRSHSLERLKGGSWNEIDATHGLTKGGAVSQLTLDETGRVWIGVDQGVLLASLQDLNAAADGLVDRIHFSPYVTAGLQASSGYSPNTAILGARWLWFCTRNGVVTADMRAAGSNAVAPKVSIEAIYVDGKEQPAGSPLRFGPRPGEINFQLAAMSFRLPEKVQLLYQIDGVDRDWVEAGKDRMAHYPRLPPGSHLLRVRAVNEDGVSSEREATLAFEVVPTFKETALFRILVLGIAVGFLLMLARAIFLRKLRKEAEALREQVAVNGERVRIARDMHDQIGASLTQISLLTELIHADGSEDKRIDQLARTVRQVSTSLDEIVWAVNPRHDYLGSVLEYLGEQAVTLLEPAGLRCRLEFPEDVPERHLPADYRHQIFLIVREALNNVVKHASASQVTLSAEITPNQFRIRIADDGRGGASGARGDGLGNMRARAAALGGSCEILSATGEGTVVDLEVPWPQRPRSS